MKRVIGVGGIFFKAKDSEKLREWYRQHLGLDVEEWGGVSFEDDEGGADLTPKRQSHLVRSLFEADTKYFAPSGKPFMINYCVRDLQEMLVQLRSEGVAVDANTEESEFGKFGWVMDPEGNWIELWEPRGKENV